MQPSLEKLRKFFRAEFDKGYTDAAVIGGLTRILDFWEGEARNDGVPEEIVQSVSSALREYADRSPQERAEILKSLWKQIQDKIPDGAPEQKTTPPRMSVPPKEVIQQQPESRAGIQDSAPKIAPPVHPGRAETTPGGVTSHRPIALNASLTVLSGIGPRNSQMLGKLGLHTLGDMLYYYPRRYDDYSQLKPIHRLQYGDVVTVIGTVQMVTSRPIRGGPTSITEAVINDGTGALRLNWFNQPWIANSLKVGAAISASGKIDQYLGRLVMNNPEKEPIDTDNLHTNRIVPIYSLTANVSQKQLRTIIHQVVSYWSPKLTDHLPAEVRSAAGLLDLGTALVQIHRPDSQEILSQARHRLAFDEIFFLQMGVLRQKRDWQSAIGRIFDVPDEWLNARIAGLPYPLTEAQKRAVDDIVVDLGSGRPMNRLLQGDVGSGKTVVGVLAAMMITRSNAQSAFMAPTSILAEQHYRNLKQFMIGEQWLPETAIRLLVGDTPDAEKEEIRTGLANGDIKVVVGTHALIEDPVAFSNLQLAVIDEQHRFGVQQRSALRAKGNNPHLLVMTATPIPRSLALTVYGDLDLSVMDELPAGRQEIETHLLTRRERERAYNLIRSQVQLGRQAFIVYPLIEESERSEKLAATAEHARLQEEVFPGLKIGLLHGRLRPDEKDAVMLKFREKEYQVLVSTTVVEVGVDIPNATVMLIEGANHFGLAQLHQLRGRVGRGNEKSFCLLIPDSEDDLENARLSAMKETNDGFILAERDLDQRGPGEFLGTRQSGYASTLRMASLTDVRLIEKARTQAQALFTRDPGLEAPENVLLAEALGRFWGDGKGDVS